MSSVPMLNWKTLRQANRVAVALRWARTLESSTHLIKDGDITRLPIDRTETYMIVSGVPTIYPNGSAMTCDVQINGWRDIVTVDIPIDLYLSLPMVTVLQSGAPAALMACSCACSICEERTDQYILTDDEHPLIHCLDCDRSLRADIAEAWAGLDSMRQKDACLECDGGNLSEGQFRKCYACAAHDYYE